MRVGLMIPALFSLDTAGNGVRVQAQAQALRALGIEVVELDPWQPWTAPGFDVLHFYSGGFPLYGIEQRPLPPQTALVFSPIIDSNQSQRGYRLASWLGQLHPKIFTIPGELARQVRGARLVVCRSQAEQRRVIEALGVPRALTRVVLNGVSPPAASPDGESLRRQLQLPERFCLHISAYTSARKNVAALIRAIAPTGIPLVIAGTASDPQQLERLRTLAQSHPQIRLLGFLDPSTRDALYAAASVFCLPSEHEGTGLAALEAATHGARVVVTRNGGTADYFEDLAEYVDPDSIDSIRSALRRAWAQPADDRLRQHVLGRLNWQESAKSLLAAYHSALASPPPA